MNGSHQSIKAIALGSITALLIAAPTRWLPALSFTPPDAGLFVGLGVVVLFFAAFFTIYLFIPVCAGGYVSALISRRRPLRDAAVVGLLFIPGSIWLDYLKAGHIHFTGIPIMLFLYALLPPFAILGARLHQRFHATGNA